MVDATPPCSGAMPKRFPDVFDPINTAPPSHSLQLPVRLCSVNFRMDYNNMDYNNLDYNQMDYNSHYVCDLCDISFSRDDALKRHMESKHGRDMKQGHTCGECGKVYNRKDNLRRHQLTCQAIRFKCPRCHRILKDPTHGIMSRTHLCYVSGTICRPG